MCLAPLVVFKKINPFVPPESLLTSEESMWERNSGAPKGKALPVRPLLAKRGVERRKRLPLAGEGGSPLPRQSASDVRSFDQVLLGKQRRICQASG